MTLAFSVRKFLNCLSGSSCSERGASFRKSGLLLRSGTYSLSVLAGGSTHAWSSSDSYPLDREVEGSLGRKNSTSTMHMRIKPNVTVYATKRLLRNGGKMEFRQVKLRSCFRGDEYGVSSVVFDPQEELLWAATFGVTLCSLSSCRCTA